MKKLLVYSHDTFGMGNIRRMLAISEYLTRAIPDLSILLVTGSPVIHSLRLPSRLDYIKLPCLTRTDSEVYGVKTLGTNIDEALKLRSDLILVAAANFKPDVVLVDKKPGGIKNELASALDYLKLHHPETKIALVLRDILDSPENTIPAWEKSGHCHRIDSSYDLVLVLGTPDVFDPRCEYHFPESVSAKVVFCGYLGKRRRTKSRAWIRQQLGLSAQDKLILVTPGGGEDGCPIIENYIAALPDICRDRSVRSLIVAGPEMPESQRRRLSGAATGDPNVTFLAFADDMAGYMEAADLVVSMGGYNTICEILTVCKRAVVIPRVEPAQEQWIRAERMARFGLFTVIHPRQLTPLKLSAAVLAELAWASNSEAPVRHLDLGALPRITKWVSKLLDWSEIVQGSAADRLGEGLGISVVEDKRNEHAAAIG